MTNPTAFHVFLGDTAGQLSKDSLPPLITRLVDQLHKEGQRESVDYRICGDAQTAADDDATINSVLYAIRSKSTEGVNLIGWGTGGALAIRIANALHALMPAIRVNILTFDPVTSSPNPPDDCRLLPPSVVRFESLLALKGTSPTLIPIIPLPSAEKQGTEITVRTVPGDLVTLMGATTETLTEEVVAPLRNRVVEFALNFLYKCQITETPAERNDPHQDWDSIHQGSEHWSGEGRRLVHLGRYLPHSLESIEGLRHNPSHQLDALFGLSSDTCTLHQDANDETISLIVRSKKIQVRGYSYLDLTKQDRYSEEEAEHLYQICAYLRVRAKTRGNDRTLRKAITGVKDRITLHLNHILEAEPLEALTPMTFFLAAVTGNTSIFQRSVDDLVNACNDEGDTALIIATRFGEEAFAQQLVSAPNKANKVIANKAGHTALAVAAMNGYPSLVYLFVQGSRSWTAFDLLRAMNLAITADQAKVVDLIYQAHGKYEPSFRVKEFLLPLVGWCIEKNKVDMLTDLVEVNPYVLQEKLAGTNQTPVDYAQALHRGPLHAVLKEKTETYLASLTRKPPPPPRSTGVLITSGMMALGAMFHLGVLVAGAVNSALVEHLPWELISTAIEGVPLLAPIISCLVLVIAIVGIAKSWPRSSSVIPPPVPIKPEPPVVVSRALEPKSSLLVLSKTQAEPPLPLQEPPSNELPPFPRKKHENN